jgi:adenosylhomocysteine nucleosidase
MRFAIIVSANAEWESVKPLFPHAHTEHSPFGEYFFDDVGGHRLVFFHGGWGKVAAAASTQYVIDHFHPNTLINLGTCGGIEGRVERLDVIAVERTVIYDIHEAMDDPDDALAHYSTELTIPDGLPSYVVRATMYSADRDLTAAFFREIDARHRPNVVDWESGAIAWVASRNKMRLLILRGVTDLINATAAEADGNLLFYRQYAAQVMKRLVSDLPFYMDALL